jgi:hypothetical protein
MEDVARITSRLDVEELYDKKRSPENTFGEQGDSTNFALESIREQGVCLEEDFPGRLKGAALSDHLKFLFSEFRIYRKSDHSPEAMRFFYRAVKEVFDRVQFEDFQNLLAQIPAHSPDDYRLVDGLTQLQCRKVRFKELKIRNFETWAPPLGLKKIDPKYPASSPTANRDFNNFAFTTSEGLKLIHRELSHQNPLALGLNDLTLFGVHDKDSGHELIIVGQRKDPTTQSCQLLLRNSWGGTCSAGLSCDAQGDIWMDEMEIFKTNTDLTYFAPD